MKSPEPVVSWFGYRSGDGISRKLGIMEHVLSIGTKLDVKQIEIRKSLRFQKADTFDPAWRERPKRQAN